MQKFTNVTFSEKKKYKLGAILSYATLAVNCLAGVFFTPYMIRHMGEEEYGLYQLIGAFVGYLSILDMGMSSSVTKYVTKYYRQNEEKKKENFLAIMLRYYTVLSVIVVILGSVMYKQVDNIFAATLSQAELIKAKKMIILLVFNMVITLFGGIFRGVMNAYECFLQTKGAELSRVVLRILMICGVLMVGGDSIGLVIVDTLLNVIFFIYRILYCINELEIRFHYYSIDIKELKEVLFFSFFVFLNLVFDQLNWKVDTTILGIKLSTVAVTEYSIGMNFANYFMNFSVAVKSLFLPKVMHMETDGANSEQYTLFMIKTGRMQGYLLFYLYFAFLFYGRQFIKIIMGKDYFEAWLSGLFVMTGLIIPLLQNAGHPILQAKNKHHIYVIVCLLISIVNATSTWLVVESRGIVGAAFMTMLSFILGQAVFLSWYYSKKIGIQMSRFYLEIIRANILPIIGVIILEMIIVKFTVIDTWTNFIVQCIVYTLMYGISILNWGMNREEKEFLFGFIKRRKLVKQHE